MEILERHLDTHGVLVAFIKKLSTELFPEWLEKKIGFKANACIDVHADDEKFLEEKTVVSLSFGHAREFCMRDKQFIHMQ